MEWLASLVSSAGGAWALLLIPVAGGGVFSLLTVAATAFFLRRARVCAREPAGGWL